MVGTLKLLQGPLHEWVAVEIGCRYGVRWCMVYADEVVYGCMAPCSTGASPPIRRKPGVTLVAAHAATSGTTFSFATDN